MRLNVFRKKIELTHAIHILDSTGDTEVLWHPAHTVSTEQARAKFAKLVSLGYLTYKADEDPVVIRDFDPQAEIIVARKQMAGG